MPGSQVGYYPNVKEFWEEIVPKKIGDYTPLERFPKTQDAVLAIAVIDGMGEYFLRKRAFPKTQKNNSGS